MRRRRYVLAAIVLAGAVVAALVGLALGGRGGHELSKQEYAKRVTTICRPYAQRLARVPEPPSVTAYGDVVESLNRVLPILRRQAAAMQDVEPPDELRPRVERLFAANRRAIGALETTLAAANRRDGGGVVAGLGSFSDTRTESKALATAIGIRC